MDKTRDIISNHNPVYDLLQPKRVKIADLRAGTESVRSKGKLYLPQYPAELDSTYTARLATATLFNLYAKTENVMTGLVFQKEIGTDGVATQILPLLENIDNKGNHLNIFARQAFEKSFDGAAIILVDAPPIIADNLETETLLGLRPYMVLYCQADVINWQYRINAISNRLELMMIVFRELTEEPSGRFTVSTVVRYRHYFLNESNQVTWEIWREIRNERAEIDYVLEATGIIEKLTALPVAIVGALDHEPPLLDLANLNLKHYQKESNFDNLEWQAAVPLFYTKGYEGEENLVVSADVHYKIPVEGAIGWAQIDSSGFESMRESLKFLTEQMSLLGLAMLADKTASVDLTATEALLSNIGETAELRVMAEQLKDALERALGFIGEMLGLGADAAGEIELGAAWENPPNTHLEQPVSGAVVPPAEPPGSELMN
jgi:hypothetical protein